MHLYVKLYLFVIICIFQICRCLLYYIYKNIWTFCNSIYRSLIPPGHKWRRRQTRRQWLLAFHQTAERGIHGGSRTFTKLMCVSSDYPRRWTNFDGVSTRPEIHGKSRPVTEIICVIGIYTDLTEHCRSLRLKTNIGGDV